MKAATLATVCVFMTLALALTASGMGYGSYGGGYTSYMPVYGGYGGSKGGLGDGGFLMLIGFLFIILFLFGNNSFFNQNRTVTTTPNIQIVQG